MGGPRTGEVVDYGADRYEHWRGCAYPTERLDEPLARISARVATNVSVVATSRTAIRSQSAPSPGNVSQRRTAKPLARSAARTAGPSFTRTSRKELAGAPTTVTSDSAPRAATR